MEITARKNRHFIGAYLVSLSFVVKPQQHLKSSIRFELDFNMADLQATDVGDACC